jgi:hypothetical protein
MNGQGPEMTWMDEPRQNGWTRTIPRESRIRAVPTHEGAELPLEPY